MSKRLLIGVVALTAVISSVVLAPGATGAPSPANADPALELAKRYAPVVRLVEQDAPCEHGEPYLPMDVNAVLGNPEVALRGPWDTTSIVKVAPTAGDLSEGLSTYHLDFPGTALTPHCDYDKWSHELSAVFPPRAYAHIVSEPSHPNKIALQYWFFYVFNDFNDKHEGDWEMIQLNFAARNVVEALASVPLEAGYGQHQGAERARWGDQKLEILNGTHPVVYPALGSHASYYSSRLYLGRSAAQGVGCDDTTDATREIRPAITLIPSEPADYLPAFPWLGYTGHWGESHRGFYDGPTGPNVKPQWTAPITWAEDWRGASFTVPAGKSLGPTATDFFCSTAATGSNLLTALVGDPSPVLLALGAIALLLFWLASRTQWSMSMPFRVRRRRPWGSLITSALRMYGAHPRLFLEIGVLFLPLGVVISAVQYLVFRQGALASLVESVGASNALVASLAMAMGVFFTVLGFGVVQAATALAIVELDEGREISALGAYRLALEKLPRLLAALVSAAIVVALLSLSFVGIVIAVWLVIRWSLLSQVVSLEQRKTRNPLRASAKLVRGHWWRVASLTLVVTGFLLLLGPLAGMIFLFATSASFDFVNLVSALIYAFTLPFAAITTAYLYFDLLVRDRRTKGESPQAEVLPAEI